MKFSILLILFFAGNLFAQVEEINARIGASDCAICFNVAQISLKQLAGAGSVNADMKSGVFNIQVKGGQGISIKDVVARLKAAGFKQESELEISVRGKLEHRGNRIVLVVPNQNELFVVEGGQKLQAASRMADEKSKVRTSGKLSGSGNQYTLKVKALDSM
jgi:hypothetical protein